MDTEIIYSKYLTAQQLSYIRERISKAPVQHRNILLNIGMLCCSGVNSHHVARIVPMLLRQLMPINIAGFFWANHDGDMIDAYVETPLFLSAEVLLLCMQFQNEAKGNWPSFTENVMKGPVAGCLQDYQTPLFYDSEHFAHTYARIGMHHIVDAVVHDGKRPYGAFLFMRSKENGLFTQEEIATIKIAMSLMPDCFNLPEQNNVPTKRTYDLGIIVVDKLLNRKFCNLTAHQILWMMTRDINTPMRFVTNDDLSSLLKQTCELGVTKAIQLGLYTEKKECHWGEFLIKYIYDAENETVAINLQQMQPYSCHLAIKLSQEKITPVRLMSTWLLLNGYVRKEIASKLQISDATCAEHIQEIFNHFNVNSVNELILNVYR